MLDRRYFGPLAFMGSLACAIVATVTPIGAWLDSHLMDTGFRVLRRIENRPVARDVAIVTIDQAFLDSVPEPLALAHPYLARFLDAMIISKPMAVGFDLVLPDRSFSFLLGAQSAREGYDAPLIRALNRARNVYPLVLGTAFDQMRRTPRTIEKDILYAAKNQIGSLNVCLDGDGMVRKLTVPACSEAGDVSAFAHKLSGRAAIVESGWINYAIGEPFERTPLVEVIRLFESGHHDALRERFTERIVLLGIHLPYEDRYDFPVELAAFEAGKQLLPGVLVHAQSVRSLANQLEIRPVPQSHFILVLAALQSASLGYVAGMKRAMALAAFVSFFTVIAGVWALRTQWWLSLSMIPVCAIAAVVIRYALESVVTHFERGQLRRVFGGYVSPRVLEGILEGRIQPGLSGKRVKVAVLFADLRGFTAMAEALEPEAVVQRLRDHFEYATRVIHENGGTVDKFMGDGLLAVFGNPDPLETPALSAAEAGLALLDGVAALNARAQDKSTLAIGIGIALGEVVAGNFGSNERHEYTVIGDCVNLASRLESMTKTLGTPIAMDANAAREVQLKYPCIDFGLTDIRGHEPAHLFGLSPKLPMST